MNETIHLVDATYFTSTHRDGRIRFLIDVRTAAEFRSAHIAGARNVPLDTLDPAHFAAQLRQEGLQHGDEVYLVCQKGLRAQHAAERLHTLLPGVQVVEGGTDACLACGIAQEGHGRGIDLQRQVQITAGSLTLLGLILGTLLHPGGYALSAFIGAGLTFAGLSGTCGLALLLARMPWNR